MRLITLLIACCITFFAIAEKNNIDPDNLFPKVKIETSMGIIIVELDRIKAPVTVNNFLTYVVEGEFDNTVFHRVIEEFIVQGGGYDKDFTMKKTYPDIVNESGNGNKNDLGTIAMAKERYPHSANRQFFFNLSDNTNLDPGREWGYAVFGEVVEGLDVIEAMGKVKTEYNELMGWDDVPIEPITLIKATLLPAE
ncbi:peptidylprolyl isomerase [Thalassotalea euphylliae]|uniref:peptidylprolyl isomerase n=1 Tax=Thalassotalea euphylliae TaxID=1655234 RepID=UPI0036405072